MPSRRTNLALAATLAGVAIGMVGLAYAAAPLYRLFCELTGFDGTPRLNARAPQSAADATTVLVHLDANVHPGLPWGFRPERAEVAVRIGEETLVYFIARNMAEVPITGRATFNVTPVKAAPYFAKLQCFCLTEQTLAAGEEVAMAVSFYVDPEMLKDPHARAVRAITLSYTFFRASDDAERNATSGAETAPATDARSTLPGAG